MLSFYTQRRYRKCPWGSSAHTPPPCTHIPVLPLLTRSLRNYRAVRALDHGQRSPFSRDFHGRKREEPSAFSGGCGFFPKTGHLLEVSCDSRQWQGTAQLSPLQSIHLNSAGSTPLIQKVSTGQEDVISLFYMRGYFAYLPPNPPTPTPGHSPLTWMGWSPCRGDSRQG